MGGQLLSLPTQTFPKFDPIQEGPAEPIAILNPAGETVGQPVAMHATAARIHDDEPSHRKSADVWGRHKCERDPKPLQSLVI